MCTIISHLKSTSLSPSEGPNDHIWMVAGLGRAIRDPMGVLKSYEEDGPRARYCLPRKAGREWL